MSKYRLRPKIIKLLRHCAGVKASAQTKLDTSSNIGRDKSFVDDLNKELGIVRMRVAFVPRSAEIQPTFWRFVITFTPTPKLLKSKLLSLFFLNPMFWFEIKNRRSSFHFFHDLLYSLLKKLKLLTSSPQQSMRIGFDGWMNCFLYSLYLYVCDNELLFLSLFFLFNFKWLI